VLRQRGAGHTAQGHRGGTGDALIFANVDPAGHPDPMTLHAGTPPKSGDKWVFSQWIRECPPGMGGGTAA